MAPSSRTVITREIEYPTSHETIRQRQQYFVLRTAAFELDRSAQTEWEREFMTEARWWSVPELRTTSETVFPPNLADLIEAAL